MLRAFVSTDHNSRWPVGVASLVVARDEEEARRLLDEALVAEGLSPGRLHPYTLQEVDLTRAAARVLVDGNY